MGVPVRAVTAARMATCGDGSHQVSLDKVIKTMKETGADMPGTRRPCGGSLALNVTEY